MNWKFWKEKEQLKSVLVVPLLSMLLELVIEILTRQSVIRGIVYSGTHPVPFFCNAMIIMCSVVLVLLIPKRIFGYIVVSLLWIGLGITDMVLLNIRVTPFNGADLKQLDSALSTADKYFSTTTVVFGMIVIGGIIAAVAVLFFKTRRVEFRINYVLDFVVILCVWVLAAASLNVSIDTGFLSKKFSNLTDGYNKYGFVYCFGNSLVNTGVKKPSGYSEEKIDQIVDDIKKEKDDAKDEKVQTPNVIFLQLESFIDITSVDYIETNQDPIPTFRKLQKLYTSGYLDVYNVGYGTCNTEFEVMTGMNLDDFGPGEVPYRTILKETTCESICYDLKAKGYATHAIHNNKARFYSRDEVFKNLGYDTFTSVEYMNDVEYTPVGWAKDECLIPAIIDCLNSTEEQDYIYTISVQGHGSYPTDQVLENPVIQVSGLEDEGRRNAFEYYANETYEMDQFVGKLIEALEEQGEDVVLVMFGDHLPGLGIAEEDLASESIYKTQYVIWDNIGLQKKDEDIQAWQLASKVMGMLGIHDGVINSLHQSLQEDDEEEYLSRLQNLTYDILYGDLLAYGGVNPYEPTNLQMGVKNITLNRITRETIELPQEEENEASKTEEASEEKNREEENDGSGDKTEDEKEPELLEVVMLEGDNFTPFSVVYVNGERYRTTFVDKEHIYIEYDSIESLDSFVVAQVDENDNILSESKECLFYGEGISEETTEETLENKEETN